METVDAGLEHGPFAFRLDGGVDFLLGLGDHFLDAGRMDTSVLDQFFQSDAGHLTADGIEAGYGNGLRSVVDDQITAGELFDASDVSSFTSDDASLHFVIGKLNDGDGHFAGVIGGTALDGCGDDLPCQAFGLFLVLCLHFLDGRCHLVGALRTHVFDQIVLCFFDGIAGDLFQHLHLASLDLGHFFLLGFHGSHLFIQGFRLLVEVIGLLVQILLFLLEPALLLGEFAAAFSHFPLQFRAVLVYFFLCL